MKRTIRLRESELRHMISESVRRVLNETEDEFADEYYNQFPGLDDNEEWKKMDSELDWEDFDSEKRKNILNYDIDAENGMDNLSNFTHDNSKRYKPYVNYLDRKHFQRNEPSLWRGHNGIE